MPQGATRTPDGTHRSMADLPPIPSADVPNGNEDMVAMLRAELEAERDKSRQAVIRHEIGAELERQGGHDAAAVREYLEAYNLDASFVPPLHALVRIFERRRSFKNLARLYDAEARSATVPMDKASALVDRGVLLADTLSQQAAAEASFTEALEVDPASTSAALMLEREARRSGNREALHRAMKARAEHTANPVLRSLLLTEAAIDLDTEDDVDGAFALAREAATLPAGRWRALEQLERLARRRERWAVVVEAVEARAALAVASAKGEDQGQASGAFSVSRFADEARAAVEAGVLYYESARTRLHYLDDPAGAVTALDKAILLLPDELLLRQQRMVACERAGDLEGAATEAAHLIERGVSGPFAAALHFRVGELAQSKEDHEGARASLTAALEADPASAAALAMLDDLLLDQGLHDERIVRFEKRAAEAGPTARRAALWRAGQIASEQLADFGRARPLYQAAIDASESPEDKMIIVRELYGAALRHGSGEGALEAGQALLRLPIDDEERGALMRELHELCRYELADEAAAGEILREALETPAAHGWAPDAARLHAARTGNEPLLAQAHGILADGSADAGAAAAHCCAAARSMVRAGNEDGAIEMLRKALERAPGHPYAVPLLEEILRSRGEADAVVALLRDAAAAQEGDRAAETNLLLAGAAAEASGDLPLARRTYEDAAQRDVTSSSSHWTLHRLATASDDPTFLLETLRGLSEREIAAGEPGLGTLDLAEHLELVAGQPEAASAPLSALLGAPVLGTTAAAQLLLLPGKDLGPERIAAAQRLLADSRDPAVVTGLLRVLGSQALAAEGGDERVVEASDAVIEQLPSDRWARWVRMRSYGDEPERAGKRADGWVALGSVTDDPEAATELSLHGLRAQLVAHGADAMDDAFILSQELAASYPESAAAAIALDETVSAGDDPEPRVEALTRREAGAGKLDRPTLRAALGRALVAAGRADEAVETLRRIVEADSEDLASWDALRVCAREQGEWSDVVRACDKLAEHLPEQDSELKAQLLEEAAAALMDHLEDDDGAESRLRKALVLFPGRQVAYGRLHDLLGERGNATDLIGVVADQLDATDDPAELAKLFYEQARLLRSEGDREGALAALDSVRMLEPDHVGAIALEVEIRVSLEQWAEAVASLQALAAADVPASQKRLARLGAADFLHKHLGDPRRALGELQHVVDLGLADAALYSRLAEIAVAGGMFEEAIAALRQAADGSSGSARASFERQAASLYHERMGDDRSAVEGYRRALSVVPMDLAAGQALADLLVDPVDRQQLSEKFELSVREALAEDPTDDDALRCLRAAAEWRGERDLERLALEALLALDLATGEEAEAHASLSTLAAPRSVPLGTTALANLRASGDHGPAGDLARLIVDTVAEMDRLEPATYGVGKGDLVNPKLSHALRDEVTSIARLFETSVGDFYVGGTELRQIVAVPGKKAPAWILGDRVQSPLTAGQRFVIGQLSMAIRSGTLPLVQRTPTDAANLLLAAALAAESPIAGSERRSGVAEIAAAFSRRMPRKVRRAVPDLAQRIPDATAVDAWCTASLSTALRAGLLVGADLTACLQAVLGDQPTLEAVLGSDMACHLLEFWVSNTCVALRRDLGYGT